MLIKCNNLGITNLSLLPSDISNHLNLIFANHRHLNVFFLKYADLSSELIVIEKRLNVSIVSLSLLDIDFLTFMVLSL